MDINRMYLLAFAEHAEHRVNLVLRALPSYV